MSPRGGDRGGRKPKLSEKGLRSRQSLNCRIDADIFDWIKAQSESTGLSVGELTDLAFETLQEYPEKLTLQENEAQEALSDDASPQETSLN